MIVIMCCRKEEEDIVLKEQLHKHDLQSLIINQFETHEIWEIDDCVRFLLEMNHREG